MGLRLRPLFVSERGFDGIWELCRRREMEAGSLRCFLYCIAGKELSCRSYIASAGASEAADMLRKFALQIADLRPEHNGQKGLVCSIIHGLRLQCSKDHTQLHVSRGKGGRQCMPGYSCPTVEIKLPATPHTSFDETKARQLRHVSGVANN